MAEKGIASRRKSEVFIAAGKVTVNGKVVTEMGVKIDPEVDKVVVDGDFLKKEEAEYVYYALNKPRGFVSAAQPSFEGEEIVLDLMPKDKRIFPVGRLDKESQGLIILTNDGRLTFDLTHPSRAHEKEYLVTVSQTVSSLTLEAFTQGIMIQGYFAQAKSITLINPRMFSIVLTEGKNRQIRRMCRNIELHVIRLKRIRIGEFVLPNIEVGDWKKLTRKEVDLLLTSE